MVKRIGGLGDMGPKKKPNAKTLWLILLSVSLSVLLLFVWYFSQKARLPGESARDLPITDRYDDIKEMTNQERRQFQSTTDRVRCEMVEVRQQVELIWENIESLESEVAKFNAVYKDVATSNQYPELLSDDFTVRYFAKDIKDPLPHVKTPIHCAERLNILMYTVNRALAKERAAFEIEYATKMKIDMIRVDVKDALGAYLMHREFLEALRALTAAGALPEAETLQEAAYQRRLQQAMKDMGHPNALREEYRPQPESKKKNKRTSSIDEARSQLMTQSVDGDAP